MMTWGILGFSIIKQSKDRGFIAINQKKGKDCMRGKNGVHERQNPPTKPQERSSAGNISAHCATSPLLGSNPLAPRAFPSASSLY